VFFLRIHLFSYRGHYRPYFSFLQGLLAIFSRKLVKKIGI